MSFSVKSRYNDEIHRFALDKVDFADFKKHLCDVYRVSDLSMTYLDEDGDYVSLSCTEDVIEAFRVVSPAVLKVFVTSSTKSTPKSNDDGRRVPPTSVSSSAIVSASVAEMKTNDDADKLDCTLTDGSKGADVVLLQQELGNRGFPVGPCDGKYGASTTKAVSEFQESMNLPSNGIVSLSTAAALGLSFTSLPLRPASQSREVRDLQILLTRRGNFCGPIDGIYGEATTAAVQCFQSNMGLALTGVGTDEVRHALASVHTEEMTNLPGEDELVDSLTQLFTDSSLKPLLPRAIRSAFAQVRTVLNNNTVPNAEFGSDSILQTFLREGGPLLQNHPVVLRLKPAVALVLAYLVNMVPPFLIPMVSNFRLTCMEDGTDVSVRALPRVPTIAAWARSIMSRHERIPGEDVLGRGGVGDLGSLFQAMSSGGGSAASSSPAPFNIGGLVSSVLQSLGGGGGGLGGSSGLATILQSLGGLGGLGGQAPVTPNAVPPTNLEPTKQVLVVQSPGTVSCLPNHTVAQSWTLSNAGGQAWPVGTKLIFVRGDREISLDEEIPIGMSVVEPGMSVVVAASLLAPAQNGKYSAHYQLADGDRVVFGPLLAVTIQVSGGLPNQHQDPRTGFSTQLAELRSMGFYDEQELTQLLQLNNGNISAVIEQLVM